MPGVNRVGMSGPLAERWAGEVDDHVIDLAWSPDGRLAAAASASGPLAVFDGETGSVVSRPAGHGFGATSLSWAPHGPCLASSGQDGRARVWEVESGAERFAVEAGAAWVDRVAWAPPGDVIATAAGKVLRFWDTWGTLLVEGPPHPSTIADIRWRARSHELASVAYGQVALWKPDRAEPARIFRRKGSILTLAWSPDGRFIATGDQDATVHFWFVRTGEDLLMHGYPTKVLSLSWDATSRYLATSGAAEAILWDCSGRGPEGRRPTMLDRREAPITVVEFRPSGPLLAVGGLDGIVRVWRIGGEPQRLGSMHLGAEITRLAWHPSGKSLLAGTATGTVLRMETPWI